MTNLEVPGNCPDVPGPAGRARADLWWVGQGGGWCPGTRPGAQKASESFFFPAQTLIIDELQQQQETLEASTSSLVLGFTVT